MIEMFSISVHHLPVKAYTLAPGFVYDAKPATWYLEKEYCDRDAADARVRKILKRNAPVDMIRIHRSTMNQETGELTGPELVYTWSLEIDFGV